MSIPNRLAVATFLLSSYSTAFAVGEAPITGAVLYPGSATIERSAQITPGMTRLEIKGLPANFDTQTIRVQAAPGIRIGQIVTRDLGRSEAASTREAEIEAKIQALQDQQTLLDVDAKSATLLQQYLEKFGGAAAVDKPQPYIDAKSMAGVIETIRRGANDVFGRQQRVTVQKRENDKKIEALQRDLQRMRNGAKDVRDITVNLNADRAGTIRIAYQVNGAGWQPGYRATLDSAASTVELERLAVVSQKTGEDWSGVKLRLSTGQPRLSPQAPEPQPWLLSYRKPMPAAMTAYGVADHPMSAPAPVMAKAAKRGILNAAPEAAEGYTPPALEVQGAFATEFEVPARVDLPADGREISVALSKLAIPVKQRVRIAPRLDKSAVVIAEAERPEGVWLGGPIQLFRDGNYVGSSRWNPQASTRFTFSFGRDDLVRVAVDRTKGEFNTTGLMSPRNERKVADVYTLTSFHKTPVNVLLLESAPVSTSDEIDVQRTLTPLPTSENWEQLQGIMAWEKTLTPNETLKFTVDYTITYPKDGSVAGLP